MRPKLIMRWWHLNLEKTIVPSKFVPMPQLQSTRSQHTQVAPGTEKQTHYKNEPPEVATLQPSRSISRRSSQSIISIPVSHKKVLWKITVLTILATISLGISLGVGLGVGLRGSNNDDTSSSAGHVPITSASSRVQRFILDNSTIAAITLSDGRREVYFQDSTGDIRQGRSLHRKRSQPLARDVVDTDRIVSDAKNNTPLAAVTMFSDHPDVSTESPRFLSRLTKVEGHPFLR